MKRAEVLTPEALITARIELGLSRVALAERMGVDYLSVRRWELPETVITRLVELAFITVVQQLLDERKAKGVKGGKDA